MPKQVNEHPQSKIKQTLGVAKKLSGVGLKFLNQLNSTQATPIFRPLSSHQIIEGTAQKSSQSVAAHPQDVQQILNAYLPHLSQRVLGKHYGKVSQFAQMVSPVSISHVTDYLSQRLGACADRLSTVETVLEQAGAANLDELRQDLSRSGRISQALVEQNKWLAATQGAFAAVTGFIGVVVDVPSILILALRAIYQTGRAYGFELNEQERDVVDYIFQQIRIDLLAEKQSLLFGLNTFSQLLQQNDLGQLQHLFGSNPNSDWLKSFVLDDEGQMKWAWLNKIPHFSNLTHLTPLFAAGVGGSYNWRFIQDVGQKSQHVFSVARDYLKQHPEEKHSILDAYQLAVAEVQHPESTPLLNMDQVIEEKPNELHNNETVQIENQKSSENEPTEEIDSAFRSTSPQESNPTKIEADVTVNEEGAASSEAVMGKVEVQKAAAKVRKPRSSTATAKSTTSRTRRKPRS